MEITIKIKSVKIKKQTEDYIIREIETFDGKKLDTYNEFKEGDVATGTITQNENPKYNSFFKILKNKKFAAKDYNIEKKISALTSAVNLCCHGKIELKQLAITRDKFFEWLNQKS